MSLKKKISELEIRLTELEGELKTVLFVLNRDTPSEKSAPTYEEVIDQWLNGKSQA